MQGPPGPKRQMRIGSQENEVGDCVGAAVVVGVVVAVVVGVVLPHKFGVLPPHTPCKLNAPQAPVT